MVRSLVSFDIAKTAFPICNLALKNIPFSRKFFERTIGIPFDNGNIIMPVEVKEYTDLLRFEGDTKYCVAPKEQLTVINSIGGFYNEDGEFEIFDNLLTSYLLRELQIPDDLLITHYLVEGGIHNTISRKDIETALYLPIETIHGKFKLSNLKKF